MRPLVHEPMKTRSIVTSVILVPGVRPIYSSARSFEARLFSSSIFAGSGTSPCHRDDVLGRGAPGDDRRQLGRVEPDDAVEMRALVA
jgi:hypothetical protein